MFKSTGVLEYHDSGWIIVICDDDLARYYRKSLRLKGLRSPPYGAHITVVNGRAEDPTNSKAWRKYEEKEIEFEYSHDISSMDGYWWVTVTCKELHDIREELGLKREMKFPLHLTVAKTKEGSE